MSSRTKWLLVGPVLAALITIGPSLVPASAAAAPARAPTITPVRLFVTLSGVLILALAVLVVWRRAGGARGAAKTERTLRVRETLRLSARSRLHLVTASGRLLLVGEGEKGVELLHLMPGGVGLADETSAADSLRRTAPAERPVDPDDDGAVPRDMVLTPVPRIRKEVPRGTDFRKLLQQVRSEATS